MKKAFWITLLLAAAGLLAAPQLILRAPLETTMGLVQKIFYYHVPFAMTSFVAIFASAIASVVYLWKRNEAADAWAVAGAELAAVFGACTLASGMLWERKAWGVWWVWDARLTTFALCEMIFIGYLLVRKYGGPGSRGLAAALALFGAADVPIIYASVFIWRTMHPQATVVPNLVPEMRPAFYTSWLTITLLFTALLIARVTMELNRSRLDALYIEAAEAGLEDA
jgi:heme exporter protein C